MVLALLSSQRMSAWELNRFGFSRTRAKTRTARLSCWCRPWLRFWLQFSISAFVLILHMSLGAPLGITFGFTFRIQIVFYLCWTEICCSNHWTLAALNASHGCLLADACCHRRWKVLLLLTSAFNSVCWKPRNNNILRCHHFYSFLAPGNLQAKILESESR